MTWWMETFSKGNTSHEKNASTIRRHLLAGKIAEVRLSELTRGRIETFLDEKRKEGLSAQTVNHIRGFLSRGFSAAIHRERWAGKNPVAETARRKGPKRLPDFLRFEEVGPVIAQVPQQHFHRFVTTLFTGLRKGELRALRKVDIDWSLKAIWVRRSGLNDTTKGGHEEPIPIHPDLEPVLREAVAASTSELVFPSPNGGMVRGDFKFAVTLRRAMARAGIVEGYLHVCRKKGCHHEERVSDREERKCPEHGVRLWPKPIVRRLTFHHLRHTAGSLFLMSGVPLEVVQKMLRHTDPKITSGVYGHLLMSYQRDAIGKARLLSPEVLSSWGAEPQEAAPGARSDLSLADSLLTGVARGTKKAGTAKQKILGVPALELERETGFEPATLSLGRRSTRLAPGRNEPQLTDIAASGDLALPHRAHRTAASSPKFGATLGAAVARTSGALLGDVELTVRGVAERLRISTATVYALCRRKELEHHRISHAIRISECALAKYLATASTTPTATEADPERSA